MKAKVVNHRETFVPSCHTYSLYCTNVLLRHVLSHEIHHPTVCSVSSGHDVRGVGSCCEGSLPPGQSHTESLVAVARQAQGTCPSVGRNNRLALVTFIKLVQSSAKEEVTFGYTQTTNQSDAKGKKDGKKVYNTRTNGNFPKLPAPTPLPQLASKFQ